MLKNLAKNEIEAIRELKDSLLKRFSLTQMKLFGSKARGDYDKESDIDLVIVLEEVNWDIEKGVFEICFEVGLKYDVLISPIVFSKDEMEDRFTKITPFYQVVEKEGIVL